MRTSSRLLTTGALLAIATIAAGQVDTGRPKDATGLCKDGTFYTGKDQSAACRSNGGLQEWWGTVAAPKDVPGAGKPAAKDTR